MRFIYITNTTDILNIYIHYQRIERAQSFPPQHLPHPSTHTQEKEDKDQFFICKLIIFFFLLKKKHWF